MGSRISCQTSSHFQTASSLPCPYLVSVCSVFTIWPRKTGFGANTKVYGPDLSITNTIFSLSHESPWAAYIVSEICLITYLEKYLIPPFWLYTMKNIRCSKMELLSKSNYKQNTELSLCWKACVLLWKACKMYTILFIILFNVTILNEKQTKVKTCKTKAFNSHQKQNRSITNRRHDESQLKTY